MTQHHVNLRTVKDEAEIIPKASADFFRLRLVERPQQKGYAVRLQRARHVVLRSQHREAMSC